METKDIINDTAITTTSTIDDEICIKANNFLSDEEIATSGYLEVVDETNSTDENKTSIEELNSSMEAIKKKSEEDSFASQEDIDNSIRQTIVNNYGNLSEEEALRLFTLIVKFNKEPESLSNEDIINLIPTSIKNLISKQMMENGVNPSKVSAASIAKQVLKDIYEESEIEANIASLDKDLAVIMDMPEITDMYFEESSKDMQESIDKSYNKLIEDGETEKAEILLKVKEAFNNALSLSKISETYINSNRIIRSIRRNKKSPESLYKVFDYAHKYKKLKIVSLKDAHEGLSHIYVVDKWSKDGITKVDVDKFVVALFYIFKELDKQDFESKTDIYYTLKNLSMLKYVGAGKTKFSQNFINNIKNMILCIKNEEAKYDATNSKNSKAKSRKSKTRN